MIRKADGNLLAKSVLKKHDPSKGVILIIKDEFIAFWTINRAETQRAEKPSSLDAGDYFEAEFTSGTVFPAQAPSLSNDAMCHDNRCFRVFLPAVMQDDPETPPIGMAQGNFGATFYHTHAAPPPAGTTWKMYCGKVAVRAQSAAADNLYFLLRDHLGSVVKSINAANGNETSLLYTAWGETRDSSGTMPTARQYTGQLQADAGNVAVYQVLYCDCYD